MRSICLFGGLLVVVLSGRLDSFAQAGKPISGNFNKYPFPAFVHDVETATGYRFYYDPEETDSLTVTIQANQLSLSQLLEQIFPHT